MGKRIRKLILIVGLAILNPLSLMGMCVCYSEYKINSLREKFTTMDDQELEKIYQICLSLTDLAQDGKFIFFDKNRNNKFPEEILYLKPRRLTISRNCVGISLFHMVDTGVNLSLRKYEDQNWALYGWFGEFTEEVKLWPKDDVLVE